MRTMNIQELEKYPLNYDNISVEIQDVIINYMNGVQQLANRYYSRYIENLLSNPTSEDTTYLRQYNHTVTSLTGSKNAFAILGIMVEYDWPNHSKKWALATRADAENFNNAQEQSVDETQTILNQLLDYTDVGQ